MTDRTAFVAEQKAYSPTAQAFLTGPRRLLIGGTWVDACSGKTFAVIDPATGLEVARVAEADHEDVDRAVVAARQAFESDAWRGMTGAERGKLLWRLGEFLLAHQDELAELESIDNGKPFLHAKGVDIPLAADCFQYYAGWASKLTGDVIPLATPYAPGARFHAFTTRAPVGVVGQIIPWNFPLLMASWKLAPALATGNTVILKPAEQTPLTALRLGELAMEAGFPPGVVNILPGFGVTAGAALTAHEGVDKIAFTGSTAVGRRIVEAAAGNLKKLTLELGGKSPNIIFSDTEDLPTAIAVAADAIFFNQGQSCCAGSRLYAQADVFDRVVEGVAKRASEIRLGAGLQPDTEMGPLVSDQQLERVCAFLDAGRREGAEAVAGGQRVGETGYFLEPTVFAPTRSDMKIVREEIFGPVLVAEPFEDEEEAVTLANDSAYGLAASVWTQDIRRAHRVADRIRAGTVWVNTYNVLDSAMPFGGFKQSGWGRELGREALFNYLETRSVCIAL